MIEKMETTVKINHPVAEQSLFYSKLVSNNLLSLYKWLIVQISTLLLWCVMWMDFTLFPSFADHVMWIDFTLFPSVLGICFCNYPFYASLSNKSVSSVLMKCLCEYVDVAVRMYMVSFDSIVNPTVEIFTVVLFSVQ